MAEKIKAPLIEAIFEIRWGRKDQNSFEYSNNEQSLFPGQISAHASNEGFTEVESFNFGPAPSRALIPQRITHRFRVGPNTWPCIQLGLGKLCLTHLCASDSAFTCLPQPCCGHSSYHYVPVPRQRPDKRASGGATKLGTRR